MENSNLVSYQELMDIQQNMQMMQKYLEDVEQQGQELELIHQAIDEFSNEKTDKEILVPIVNGIFFKAKLTDNSKFLVNIGADGTIIELDSDKAKNIIKEQIEKIRENQVLISLEYDKLLQKFNELNKKQSEQSLEQD